MNGAYFSVSSLMKTLLRALSYFRPDAGRICVVLVLLLMSCRQIKDCPDRRSIDEKLKHCRIWRVRRNCPTRKLIVHIRRDIYCFRPDCGSRTTAIHKHHQSIASGMVAKGVIGGIKALRIGTNAVCARRSEE